MSLSQESTVVVGSSRITLAMSGTSRAVLGCNLKSKGADRFAKRIKTYKLFSRSLRAKIQSLPEDMQRDSAGDLRLSPGTSRAISPFSVKSEWRRLLREKSKEVERLQPNIERRSSQFKFVRFQVITFATCIPTIFQAEAIPVNRADNISKRVNKSFVHFATCMGAFRGKGIPLIVPSCNTDIFPVHLDNSHACCIQRQEVRIFG